MNIDEVYTLHFSWDENKNKINIEKHGVSFEEAKTVFYDEEAILFDDPEHSTEEDRFILIGMSEKLHVCTVCHWCYRNSDNEIRIISARKATTKEVERYAGRI